MKNILVITEPTAHAFKWVQSVLETHGVYQISQISQEQLLESKILMESQFDFIVFDCDWLDHSEVQFLQYISRLAPESPFIVLAQQITIYSYGQVHELQNIMTFQTPCNPQVFLEVVNRILQKQGIKSNICSRFITNVPVNIIVLGNGLFLPTRLRNYSATGAFLEYHGISLKVGDLIQMNLGRPRGVPQKKDDSLLKEARIVWIRDSEKNRSPTRGVGVQFVNS